MRKFFYLIILFFIFTISVNAVPISGSSSICATGGASHGLVYNTNGGGSIETTMFCSACFHEDTSLPIPVKEGYEFGGWYYDSSFKQKVETNNINEVKYTQLYNENGFILTLTNNKRKALSNSFLIINFTIPNTANTNSLIAKLKTIPT